jgi:hypothetical protein
MRQGMAVLVLIVLLSMGSFVTLASTEAGADAPVPAAALSLPSSNVTDVEVGIYVNGISNFDFGNGAYSLDFYLWFVWTDPTIKNMAFEIMNGQPAYNNAFVKIIDDTNGTVKTQWYRLRAILFIPPDLASYPFEAGGLKVQLEDSSHNSSSLRYHWAVATSGYDKSSVVIPGWKIAYLNYSVADHAYTFNENYSQAVFVMQVERNSLPAAIQLIMPPIIFCLVSSLSYFFNEKKDSYIGLRLGLNSSMIISAVLFYYGQQSTLPPMSSFSIFDELIIAVYVFLGLTIAVTVAGVVEADFFKHPSRINHINRYGAIIAIAVSVTVFVLLEGFNV